MTGTAYRVKATHPRRPGQPLVIRDRAGRFLAGPGDLCGHLTPDQLRSVIAQGFVEALPAPLPSRAKAARDREE